MSERGPDHVRNNPLAGDVIEITERATDPEDGGSFEIEVMLRVVAVHEDRVWFKQYGKGHALATVKSWRERLAGSLRSKLVRGGDHDCPF